MQEKQPEVINHKAQELWKTMLCRDIEIMSSISRHIPVTTLQLMDIGVPNDGVTDDLSFETGTVNGGIHQGVPDLNQFESSLWTGPSGCSPTSAANIMKWWATPSNIHTDFPQLTQGLSDEQLLFGLRTHMNTYFSNGQSATSVNDIAPGMQSFAIGRGCSSARGWYIDPPTWFDYRLYITFAGPNVISFSPHDYYGEHSVTGVGYYEFKYNGSTEGHQYMVVHDNRSNTSTDVYVAWGRNYSAIYIDQFNPTGDN